MPALAVSKLTKVYRNGHRALKGVDLTVNEGDFFALLGPNGAGKSTLIGIVTSLVNKTGGEVRVFGHDLDREPGLVKASVGLVPQEFNFNLFLPVIEVVINQAGYYGIPRCEAKVGAEYVLRQLDLWDRRDSQMRMLSSGMKRRLMIARALVHRPRLLILDEPTAGVDIEIRHAIWGFLRKLNANGTTIILTTHYLEEAEGLCRNTAIINEGRTAESVDMETLLGRLTTQTLVLDFKGQPTRLPQLEGFVLKQRDDHTLEVEVAKGTSINGLFEVLSHVGVEVVGLRNKQNRLEQLFLSLVENHNGSEDMWA